jgi:D-3-phosphoglycerate dehydrogenase
MKVTVLAQPLKTGSWRAIEMLKDAGAEYNFIASDLGSEDEVIDIVKDADATIAGSEPYTPKVIEACSNLKVVARSGVGYDAVDVEACNEAGVLVTITPGVNQDSVADLTFSFLMAFLRNIVQDTLDLRAGKWGRPIYHSARESVLGVVGLGRIGQAVVKRALPFGFKILVAEKYPDADFVAEHELELVELEELLNRSDYVTLHVPLLPETQNLINSETIGLMKEGACLINTARGGLTEEAALVEGLKSGKLRGAGLDVFPVEPPTGSPLLELPNVLATPHLAGLDHESAAGMASMAVSSILEILQKGRLPDTGVINPEIWERRRV